MKVAVEMKITFLEGEEKGRTIQEKQTMDTISEVTKYGKIERLKIEWNYIHCLKNWEGVDESVE